jgi:hypothetical protein
MDTYFEQIEKIFMSLSSNKINFKEGIKSLKKRWNKGKKWMLPYFGNDGRIEIDCENIAVDKQTIKNQYCILKETANNFYRKEKYSNICSYDIINIIVTYLDKLTPEEIMQNRIITTEIPWSLSDYFQDIVPKGTKISKIFTKLPRILYNQPSYVDEEILYEYVNMLFSVFVSTLKSNAKVVLSINPLDFLLVAAHTTGWRSCHNFIDGQYKTGGLAYMCDKESAVAYSYSTLSNLKNMHENLNYKEDLIDWPLKRWRQMVFLDKENLVAIHNRQYPNYNPIYEKNARRLSAKVLSDFSGCKYKWFVNNSHDKDESEEFEYSHISTKYRSTKHSYRDSISSILRMKDGNKFVSVKVSTSSIPCIVCGKPNRIYEGKSFMCESCRNIYERSMGI